MAIEGIRSKNGADGTQPPAMLRLELSSDGHRQSICQVSVVIPARNEARSLPDVLGKLPPWVHEVILVDGLSVDETSLVAKREMPTIRVVEQSGRGKGNALREGFLYCTGDIVIALDADGSMDPAEMGRFVQLVSEGYDYVKGSRMLTGGSSADLTRLRTFGNWVFRTLTNWLTGSRYSDLCYGYFAFRRGTIDTLDLQGDGFEIETEINIRAHRAGLRIAEVPSAEWKRQHGSSQLSAFRDGLRILNVIFRTTFSARDQVAPAPPIAAGRRSQGAEPATVVIPLEGDGQAEL